MKYHFSMGNDVRPGVYDISSATISDGNHIICNLSYGVYAPGYLDPSIPYVGDERKGFDLALYLENCDQGKFQFIDESGDIGIWTIFDNNHQYMADLAILYNPGDIQEQLLTEALINSMLFDISGGWYSEFDYIMPTA